MGKKSLNKTIAPRDISKNLQKNREKPIKLNHKYPLRNRSSMKENEKSNHSDTEAKKFVERSTSKISTNDLKTKQNEDKQHKRLRVSSVDSPGLNSARLVNLIRPLRIYDDERTTSSDNQIQLAVEEYSLNRGIVGVSAHLNNPSAKEKYTTDQLNNAADNMEILSASFELSAKKFFKNDKSKRTVYDFEIALKDCREMKPLRPVQKLTTEPRSQNRVLCDNTNNETTSMKSSKRLKQSNKKEKIMEVGAQGNEIEVEDEMTGEKQQVEEMSINESCQSFDSVIDVLRHKEDTFKNIEISTLTKEIQVHCHSSIIDEEEFYKNRKIEKDKNELKEYNLNHTLTIQDDLSSCGQLNQTDKSIHEIDDSNDEELNDIEINKNISLPSISCSSISRNSDENNIYQTQEIEINNEVACNTSTPNDDRTYIKRKITEKKSQLALKKLRFSRENKCDEAGETAVAQANGKLSLTDFLKTYKEKLYAKVKDINEKYEKKILMNGLEKSEESVDKHFKSIENITNSLEMNKLIIFDLKSKLQEKEDERMQLISKRDEHFEKIRNIYVEIDNFYETNKENFELEYNKSKNEIIQCSVAIRNELWQNHLEQIINTFVESLGLHYIFDDENSNLRNP